MKFIIFTVSLLVMVQCFKAEEVRLLDLEPNDAQQIIEKQDQSLSYAPKIESNVPAVRFLGNEPHHVQEDIYLAKQYHGQDGLGGYIYGYNVPDIAKTEKKIAGGDLRGAYNYIAGDGQEIKVEYWDDGTGFHQIDNAQQIQPKQVDDAPDVKEAKEKFLARWNEEAERNSHGAEVPYTGEGAYNEEEDEDKPTIGQQPGQYQQQGQYQQPGQHQQPGQNQQPGQYQKPYQAQQQVPQQQLQQGQYQKPYQAPQVVPFPKQDQYQKSYQAPVAGNVPKSPSPQGYQVAKYQAGGQSQGGQFGIPVQIDNAGQYSENQNIYSQQVAPKAGQPVAYASTSNQGGQQPGQYHGQQSGPNQQSSQGGKSGQYVKSSEEEENSGPPKGFFYSFDYPVGIIVKKEGLVKDVYSENKARFESQLQTGHSEGGTSQSGYLYTKN